MAKKMKTSNSDMSDDQLIQWQEKQFYDSIVDNMVNTASEMLQRSNQPPATGYTNENDLEQSAILMAIQSHGLQHDPDGDPSILSPDNNNTTAATTTAARHSNMYEMEIDFMNEAIMSAISSQGLDVVANNHS